MVFLYSKWMALPLATKLLLSKQFGFSKTGSTHVSDNRVIDDGYKIIDVENTMNTDAIQKYLGQKYTDFDLMWSDMIAKVEGRTIEKTLTTDTMTISKKDAEALNKIVDDTAETITVAVEDEPEDKPIAKKKGRPAKK